MQKHVVFRADASSVIGGGHVARCLALADCLVEKGWHCTFVVSSESVASVAALRNSPFRIRIAELIDDSEAVRGCAPMDLVVVDHYQLAREFERGCRIGSARIAIIDDLANRPHEADLLVDATLGRSDQDYKSLVPGHCRLLLGPSFALLRHEFAVMGDVCAIQRSARPVKRILVCMGNSDMHDVTTLAMDMLEKRSRELVADIVLGAKSPNYKKVEARIEKMGPRFRLHVDTTEMARLMCDSDLAIGSCGVSALERCAVGLPAIGIITADNQQLSARRLADRGAIVLAGSWSDLSVRVLGDILDRTLAQPDKIAALSKAAAQICDGKGALRVALEVCGHAT